MSKDWVGNIEQLREYFTHVADDMKLDQKPRSIEVKLAANKRSLELNSVYHIVIRQIRKHLFDAGLGFVEYEDEFTGKPVKMPLDEEMVKAMVKDQLGVKITVLGSSIAKPTRNYTQDEMVRHLKRVETWAATDLNLVIEYKERVRKINEKYKEAEDGK